MSGGSWDYFCFRMDDVADRLCGEKEPLRRAFGEHMRKCAAAMKAIEWYDSGDWGPDDAAKAMNDVFGDDAERKTIEVLLADGGKLISQLKELGVTDSGK